MGQEDRDIEKADPSDLEKTGHSTDDTSSIDATQPVSPGLTKEPDVPAAAAPPSNTEDVLELAHRSSHESSSTHPDTDEPSSPKEPTQRAISVRSEAREAIKVPRGQRRGLLANLAIIAEVTDPKDYPRKTKWMITFVVAIAGAAAPMGSSILLPALVDITRAFNSTPTVVNLSVAMFMLSMSIFPLWWSSFSETLGRRTIYISSFALFLVFNILSAVSTDIAMFVTMRVFSGGAAASVQAVGAGTIADIWEVKERGRAMGIFYLGPLCGPLLAPIIGGALAEGLGWRSNFWFMTIYGGFLLIFIIFALPETLKDRKPVAAMAEAEAVEQTTDQKSARPNLTRTSTRQSVTVKTRKYGAILRRCFLDPLRIILYLRFPAVAISVYYASITFGSLYVLNISVQATFSTRPYDFSTIIVGCTYIPNSLGYFLSSIFGGRWVDAIMHREARKAGRYDEKGRLQFRPEDRMKENAWIAAILYPCALIWYGWTVQYGVFWLAPMIANFFFGVGSMLIFAMVTTMLTEFMPRKASHGIAVNNFVRNIFSCVGGIVAEPLIVAIGNGWLFTGLGLICLISGPIVIMSMKRWGDHWRITMDREMEKAMGD